MEMKEAIGKVVRSQDLSEDEAFRTAQTIMRGGATDAQIAAVLTALRVKGETQEEITGFARAMKAEATPVPCRRTVLVDTCGTGGDGSGTFNVSTVSALVAAGAGCAVAKHGNRSVSSRCGSADLFASLGVNIEAPPETAGRCIDENGVGFLFAPLLHKAMKHAAGPRREIGVRTLFNILGPLTNPAGARRQVLGVFDGSLTVTLATVLKRLGSEHVLVVHGGDGLDEITLAGSTAVAELKDGSIDTYSIRPEDFGLERSESGAIRGGDPGTNAGIALNVLRGGKGPARDVVLLNAGAVAYVGGLARNIGEGIRLAEASIDSGNAMAKLEGLRRMTQNGRGNPLFRLDALLAAKREEIRGKRGDPSFEAVLGRPFPPLRDFASALQQPGLSIIAEMKRKSPSAGILRESFYPAVIAADYEKASASALSVLTDREFFGGVEDDVLEAKRACRLPVLRKEFIIDEIQVMESRAIGADAILLIVRILPRGMLRRLLELAGSLGLACLVETRNEAEMETAVLAGAEIVGVNNRDLDTLSVDLRTSLNLASRIPDGVTKVSESGIRTPDDVRALRDAGFDGLLIGEALLRAGEGSTVLRELAHAAG